MVSYGGRKIKLSKSYHRKTKKCRLPGDFSEWTEFTRAANNLRTGHIAGPVQQHARKADDPSFERLFFNLVEIGKNWIIFNKNICFFATCVLYYSRDILRIDQ